MTADGRTQRRTPRCLDSWPHLAPLALSSAPDRGRRAVLSCRVMQACAAYCLVTDVLAFLPGRLHCALSGRLLWGQHAGLGPCGEPGGMHCWCAVRESAAMQHDCTWDPKIGPRWPVCTITDTVAGLQRGQRCCSRPTCLNARAASCAALHMLKRQCAQAQEMPWSEKLLQLGDHVRLVSLHN
jgi:hypothetical protein